MADTDALSAATVQSFLGGEITTMIEQQTTNLGVRVRISSGAPEKSLAHSSMRSANLPRKDIWAKHGQIENRLRVVLDARNGAPGVGLAARLRH